MTTMPASRVYTTLGICQDGHLVRAARPLPGVMDLVVMDGKPFRVSGVAEVPGSRQVIVSGDFVHGCVGLVMRCISEFFIDILQEECRLILECGHGLVVPAPKGLGLLGGRHACGTCAIMLAADRRDRKATA